MRALIYREFGPPEVLSWADDWPEPTVRPGQVLVDVAAGSVNPKDVLLRKGKFVFTRLTDRLPRASGLDFAGKVAAVGDGQVDFSPGDAVFGMSNAFCGGVHAERAVLGPDEIARLPSRLSLAEAAAVPLAAQTALQALRDYGGLQPGQRVLINGASGGVGHFAVQIARAMGAAVHAVCGPGNVDLVRGLGAAEVTSYEECAPTEIAQRFDIVFDVFGKLDAPAFRRQLEPGGVYINTIPRPATLRDEILHRMGLRRDRRLVVVRSSRQDLDQLGQWIERGELRPHVEKVYPVAEAAAAHRHVESRHTTGKVVITF